MDFFGTPIFLYFGGIYNINSFFCWFSRNRITAAPVVFLVFSCFNANFASEWISNWVSRSRKFNHSCRNDLERCVNLVFLLQSSNNTADKRMTSAVFLRELFMCTLTNPKQAAQMILEKEFSYDVIWSVFIASICAATAMQFSVDSLLSGSETSLIAVSRPSIFALMVASITLLVCVSITWTGQRFGGQAQFKSIFALLSWLQLVQLILQASIYVILTLVAALAALAQIIVLFWTMWIFVAFLDTAHGFENMFKSALAALLGVSLGGVVLFLLISIIGMGL